MTNKYYKYLNLVSLITGNSIKLINTLYFLVVIQNVNCLFYTVVPHCSLSASKLIFFTSQNRYCGLKLRMILTDNINKQKTFFFYYTMKWNRTFNKFNTEFATKIRLIHSKIIAQLKYSFKSSNTYFTNQ